MSSMKSTKIESVNYSSFIFRSRHFVQRIHNIIIDKLLNLNLTKSCNTLYFCKLLSTPVVSLYFRTFQDVGFNVDCNKCSLGRKKPKTKTKHVVDCSMIRIQSHTINPTLAEQETVKMWVI